MIKKGSKVKVLTGRDKKKEGEVIEIDRPNNRAKVQGINIVKKHVKTTKEKKGGIISKEIFLSIIIFFKANLFLNNLSESLILLSFFFTALTLAIVNCLLF